MAKSGSTVSLKMQQGNYNPTGHAKVKQYCLSTAYLAPVEYYMLLSGADKILLEQHDFFVKQTYRNRCTIATANGVMDLIIPVERPAANKALIKDIRISDHGNWRLNHWKAIMSAYQSSPFFEYYADDLVHCYEKQWNFLWDFNLVLQEKLLLLLDVDPEIQLTDRYLPDYHNEYIDLREAIHPKKESVITDLHPYYQVFSQKFGFQKNLSIIDLLFNMGNESILILKDC